MAEGAVCVCVWGGGGSFLSRKTVFQGKTVKEKEKKKELKKNVWGVVPPLLNFRLPLEGRE